MAPPLQAFVARRRPDWEALAALLERQRRGGLRLADVRALDRLSRAAAADLARAQAHYPGTDAHRYLNQLCARAYAGVYGAPRARLPSLRAFFLRDFPAAVRAEARYVALSAALLVAGLVLGALAVWLEPGGAALLVPPGARAAVDAGRLWTDDLLTVMPPGVAASAIATNNLSVTVTLFATGVLLGAGPVLLLLFNGVQVGALLAYAGAHGLGGRLLDFVAAHGPVELSVVVVAGAAGLVLGHALLEPGELPRRQALRLRGRQGARLVLGCAPPLALIALVEGFVSPGSLFPTWVKAALGLTLGALFWAYLARAGRDASPSHAAGVPADSASSRLR